MSNQISELPAPPPMAATARMCETLALSRRVFRKARCKPDSGGTLGRSKDSFLLRPTQHTVILLGASGTGKTSFSRRLRGLAAYVPREMRTRVSESVTGKLKGRLKLKLIETPGEIIEPFSIHRRESISKAMKERTLGIVNVVSYGYHEGGSNSSLAVTQANAVRSRFLSNRRQEEIHLLDEWKNTLCAPGGPARWLITVCSKADLWWTPKDAPDVIVLQ
jgi:hypothetical protein